MLTRAGSVVALAREVPSWPRLPLPQHMTCPVVLIRQP
jgi:hypothetical protein